MKTTWFRAALMVVTFSMLATTVRADDLWLVDFKAAKEQAAKEGKDILMEFTGSDWCPPCKALQEKVLSKDVFRDKMPEKYVLLKLDSPRDKSKQTPEEIEQYKQLSVEYKISGVPTIILVDAQGRPFSKTVGFGGGEAEQYVAEMIEKVSLRKTRDEKLAKAESVAGAEKAKLLHDAISELDGELVVATYRDIVDQIVALDGDNGLGLKSKFEGIIKTSEVRAAVMELQQSARGLEPAQLVSKIDELIERLAPAGEALQDVLMFKGSVLFQSDKAKSLEALQAALKAAPDTQTGKQIPLIIERNFKDLEKDTNKDEDAKKPAEKPAEKPKSK